MARTKLFGVSVYPWETPGIPLGFPPWDSYDTQPRFVSYHRFLTLTVLILTSKYYLGERGRWVELD